MSRSTEEDDFITTYPRLVVMAYFLTDRPEAQSLHKSKQGWLSGRRFAGGFGLHSSRGQN